jgi:hypothetical protein
VRIFEVRDGELSISPIATCESEEKEIIDAIRTLLKSFEVEKQKSRSRNHGIFTSSAWSR